MGSDYFLNAAPVSGLKLKEKRKAEKKKILELGGTYSPLVHNDRSSIFIKSEATNPITASTRDSKLIETLVSF